MENNRNMSFNGKKLARNEQMDRFMFMKIFGLRGLSAPAPGLYTCVWPKYSNNFFSETALPIKTKHYVDQNLEGE